MVSKNSRKFMFKRIFFFVPSLVFTLKNKIFVFLRYSRVNLLKKSFEFYIKNYLIALRKFLFSLSLREKCNRAKLLADNTKKFLGQKWLGVLASRTKKTSLFIDVQEYTNNNALIFKKH